MNIDDLDLQFGDILCEKSFTFLGWAIGNSFHVDSPLNWKKGTPAQRKRPSNHNGVIGYDGKGNLCVFEALAKGIEKTSLEQYFEAEEKNKCELKFMRLPILWNEKAIEFGQHYLECAIGKKYDYLSFISHIWRNTLNLPGIKVIQSDNRFYCTEFVMRFYQFIRSWSGGQETDFFKKTLPTPYTVEKRWKEGKLICLNND